MYHSLVIICRLSRFVTCDDADRLYSRRSPRTAGRLNNAVQNIRHVSLHDSVCNVRLGSDEPPIFAYHGQTNAHKNMLMEDFDSFGLMNSSFTVACISVVNLSSIGAILER